MSKLIVDPIPAFSDNYIWALTNNRVGNCVVVDPGDAASVLKYLAKFNLQLSAILITHHHHDHIGGIEELTKQTGCRVYGPYSNKIEHIDTRLRDGDQITIDELSLTLAISEVPGHTLDHIAYYIDHDKPKLFVGDTLFAGGCGRMFEGTAPQMLESLEHLGAYPPQTLVFCAHEYTLSNLEFASHVEPNNRNLQQRLEDVVALRANNQITLPTTLELERQTNPFLRCNEQEVVSSAETFTGGPLSIKSDVFAAIRKMKDNF
ncbi:MAG: hydroxyacylglutathione hydrolase [Kangiellaceae bacterium]|jgi:hydroxyacylglutathione hydrolase|nr:hydroxyacylglutathione hydrolase [Kangiellaceae bacterium]